MSAAVEAASELREIRFPIALRCAGRLHLLACWIWMLSTLGGVLWVVGALASFDGGSATGIQLALAVGWTLAAWVVAAVLAALSHILDVLLGIYSETVDRS